jgi:hypothetical protein
VLWVVLLSSLIEKPSKLDLCKGVNLQHGNCTALQSTIKPTTVKKWKKLVSNSNNELFPLFQTSQFDQKMLVLGDGRQKLSDISF